MSKATLCGDCHFDKSKEYYEGKVRQPCVVCGMTQKITDLWEPRWQWDMEGLLCKKCFDKKEEDHGKKKEFLFSMWRKNGTNQIQSKRELEDRRPAL